MCTGMGNRFFTMEGYHALIRAHGVIAAITFLGAVPTAIFLMRFYGRNPRLALRMHIWLQILTLLLTTVVFILGFMAVGPNRNLSNPHHGIGVAIYVLIWVQVLGGCFAHRNKKRTAPHRPLRIMLHQWAGRAIALLGITQVALGLTLYGSPLYLFVLYTLLIIAFVIIYFILSYLAERRQGQRLGGHHGSHYSEEVVTHHDEHRDRSGWGKWLLGGAAALGLASLWRRRSNKSQRDSSVSGTGTSVSSSYFSDEKYSNAPERRREKGGFGNRLLQIAAIGGAVAAARKLFGGGRRDDESDTGPYRPPLGGNQSVTDSMSRVEEGQAPLRPTTPIGNSPGQSRPTHPLAQPPMTPGSTGRRDSGSTYSYYDDSFVSGSPSRRDRRSHTFRDAMAAGGAVFAVRSLFKNRRQRKEDIRTEALRKQRIEQEKVQRMNSAHKYTGDGVRPPRRSHGRMGSQSASDISTVMGSTAHHGMSGALPAAGVGAAAASALADRDRIRPVGADPPIVLPGPSTAGVHATDIPPVPPPHRSDYDSSGSELYTTQSGRQHHRHRNEAAAGLAGAALGAMAAEGRHKYSGRTNANTDSVESPPVSVKINMHNDGRKVTLRRLTEEEAAAQREAKREERQASAAARRRRNTSLSSSDAGEIVGGAGPSTAADRRWRRTEALEAQQAAENAAAAASNMRPQTATPAHSLYPSPPPPGTSGIAVDHTTGQAYQMPLPPPIPGSHSNLGPAGSITSPGTETSGATEYANNRRRRRAERAQARLAREGRGNTVDFT